MVYITTPVIPSCFLAFFSDPYSLFENFSFYHSYELLSEEFREEFCLKNMQQSMIETLLEFVLDTE